MGAAQHRGMTKLCLSWEPRDRHNLAASDNLNPSENLATSDIMWPRQVRRRYGLNSLTVLSCSQRRTADRPRLRVGS